MFNIITARRDEDGRTLAESAVTIAVLGMFFTLLATLMTNMYSFNAQVSTKLDASNKISQLTHNIMTEAEYGDIYFDTSNPQEIQITNEDGTYKVSQTDEGIVRTSTTPDGIHTKRVLLADADLTVSYDGTVVSLNLEYPYETKKGQDAAEADLTLRTNSITVV